MTLTNLKIKDLINDDAKLTFLVGAGCSIDAPSCLSDGRAANKAIINYTCAKIEAEKILKLKNLRFEQLVEILRDKLDPKLKFIDYYGQCDKPNMQHFFLANMITKGHFVMTVNFDFLIEHALLQSGVKKKKIRVVITEEDFKTNDNPSILYDEGIKALFKIHGSTRNMIKDEETRDSLVATIQAFGSGKEGESVFQLEPFKRPLFENISNNRTLVVMGYSGSDDFDIGPTLKRLKNIVNIIWIDFTPDDDGSEKIYEISESMVQETKELDKVNQILVGIYRMHNARHVYRVNANTTRLIRTITKIKQKPSSESFTITVKDWLEDEVDAPSQKMQYYIPYHIYYNFSMYDDAMRCLEEIINIAEKNKNQFSQSVALSNIGAIYQLQGNYQEALKRFEEALIIFKQLKYLEEEAGCLNNIGGIYSEQGDFPKALKLFEKALEIMKNLKNFSGESTCLNNIAVIHHKQGNYLDALKKYEKVLLINEQLGDLLGKALILNNIGEIYRLQGKFLEALKRFEEALMIDEQLVNLLGKSAHLNNIGLVYYGQWNLPEALKRYEEALMIDEQLGDLLGKAMVLNNIGEVYRVQGNFPEALKRFEEALSINDQIKNLSGKAMVLNNIATISHIQGNTTEALKLLEDALKIDEQLKDLSGKARRLANIGEVYRLQEKFPEALEVLEESLKIGEYLKDLAGNAMRLSSIGMIYCSQGRFPEALIKLEEALRIDEQLEDLLGKAVIINSIGIVYNAQGRFSEARENFNLSLEIYNKLGLSESSNIITTKANLEFTEKIMSNLRELAETLYKQEKFKEALQTFHLALQTDGESNNIKGMALNHWWIGFTYDKLQNKAEAINHLEKALELYRSIEDNAAILKVQKDLITRLRKFGKESKDQGKLDEALDYHKKAIEIAEEIEDKSFIASCFNSIAAVYYARANYELALEKFLESFKLHEKNENVLEMGIQNHWIGLIYEKKQDLVRAISYLEQALKSFTIVDDKQGIKAVQNDIDRIKTQGLEE